MKERWDELMIERRPRRASIGRTQHDSLRWQSVGGCGAADDHPHRAVGVGITIGVWIIRKRNAQQLCFRLRWLQTPCLTGVLRKPNRSTIPHGPHNLRSEMADIIEVGIVDHLDGPGIHFGAGGLRQREADEQCKQWADHGRYSVEGSIHAVFLARDVDSSQEQYTPSRVADLLADSSFDLRFNPDYSL